jgi:hypothetical protein
MRWEEIVSWVQEIENTLRSPVENLNGRISLRKVGIGGMMLLKWTLRKHGIGTKTGSIYFG